MKEQLIKISEDKNGNQTISGKDLYEDLGFEKSQWSRWYKKNIEKNPYAQENKDWIRLDIMSNGNETKDFVLTLDFAERLAMLARSDRGEQVRRWFQSLKKSSQPKILTAAEHLLANAQLLVSMEKRQEALENRMIKIEAQTTNRPDYLSIMGYAITCKTKVSLNMAAQYGKQASKICKERGYPIDKVRDPRFGEVGVYPTEVLQEIFQKA